MCFAIINEQNIAIIWVYKAISLKARLSAVAPRTAGNWYWLWVWRQWKVKRVKLQNLHPLGRRQPWVTRSLCRGILVFSLWEEGLLLCQGDLDDQEFLRFSWVYPDGLIPVLKVSPTPSKSILKLSHERSDEFTNSNYIVILQTLG